MARVEHGSRGRFILPETDEERALIAHGAEHGHTLVLLEGYYPVQDQALVLPDTANREAAQRVCTAFEHAASTHQQAVRRRERFRLLKD